MRIVGSQIQLNSRREYSQTYSLRETLRVRAGPEAQAPQHAAPAVPADRLELSEESRRCAPEHAPLPPEEQLKVLILRALLGIVVRLAELPQQAEQAPELPPQTRLPAAEPAVAWGMAYDRHERYEEHERLQVSASGVVRTADGREIKFDVTLDLNRSFVAEHRLSVRAGNLKVTDPLVINFGGTLAGLTDRRYAFDLNADGVAEQVPFVAPGAGFLALDRNGDGRVGDGRELFGPATGNGFAELARYDADGNGWIDEGDPVFSRLRIWLKDAAGADQLVPLSQLQVGAILLGNLDAGFAYKDQQNTLLAQQQRVGIYLRQDGTAGSVQQIDMAI